MKEKQIKQYNLLFVASLDLLSTRCGLGYISFQTSLALCLFISITLKNSKEQLLSTTHADLMEAYNKQLWRRAKHELP